MRQDKCNDMTVLVGDLINGDVFEFSSIPNVWFVFRSYDPIRGTMLFTPECTALVFIVEIGCDHIVYIIK